ncbi:MAG: UPF0236 family protein [Peptococcaceae bacterium MAG4]|nr:UPF0236 family protein [Peptococcaceae bacterium MAG4]
MIQIRDLLKISFRELEINLFQELGKTYLEVLKNVLKALDELLMEERDKERYETRGIRSRQIETLFGTLEYKRRYYLDVKTGTYVCLLDQALGIEKKIKVSPGLSELAVYKGVKGGIVQRSPGAIGELLSAAGNQPRDNPSTGTGYRRANLSGRTMQAGTPCRRTPGADIISRSRWHMGKSAAGVKKQSRKSI